MASLRAVKPGEKPPARKKMTVAEAVAEGDDLDQLYAQRARLAEAMASDKCSPRDLAPLSRQLNIIRQDIKALEEALDVDDDAGPAEDHFDASAI